MLTAIIWDSRQSNYVENACNSLRTVTKFFQLQSLE